MCSIFGALYRDSAVARLFDFEDKVIDLMTASVARGRDGVGFHFWVHDDTSGMRGEGDRKVIEPGGHVDYQDMIKDALFRESDYTSTAATIIGNMRAEPTTEFVKEKSRHDQQPYSMGGWTIVHNGTIANDKELRSNSYPSIIDSAAIVEALARMSSSSVLNDSARAMGYVFENVVGKLKGSYAILAVHEKFPHVVFAACNYRPIWYGSDRDGTYIASAREFLPKTTTPAMLPPYSIHRFARGADRPVRMDDDIYVPTKALVVCSGGLDSTVAAAAAKQNGYQVELLHFQYGSRAEGPETVAVKAVAEALGVPLRMFPLPIYKPEDSPLLRADSTIAGGEAGAEFAHEWVPARNLVMLSITTAVAEANGFDVVILGNNLEEAGAYPDNEPEFIARFNDLLPFAVADGKKVRVEMPVGNMMKHEIVKLGNQINAPLDKTWSCYRAGGKHCGTCGPCFMRRTAFEINGLSEVIEYEK